MLNSINGQFVFGVSGRHVGSIFKSQDVQNFAPQGCKWCPETSGTTQTRSTTKQNIAKPELQRGETRHSCYDNEYVYGLSRNWRYETVQDQNNQSPHIFHFMHNPRNSLELCDRFRSPCTAGRSNTFIMWNIGILQITRIHFTRTFAERISRATGTVQCSTDTEWSLYKTVLSSTKCPLTLGASSPMLSTLNDGP